MKCASSALFLSAFLAAPLVVAHAESAGSPGGMCRAVLNIYPPGTILYQRTVEEGHVWLKVNGNSITTWDHVSAPVPDASALALPTYPPDSAKQIENQHVSLPDKGQVLIQLRGPAGDISVAVGGEKGSDGNWVPSSIKSVRTIGEPRRIVC